MWQTIKLAYSISRPRFWLYLAGPYMIGYLLGATEGFPFSITFWAHVIFFLIPANIFIYGLNDLADQDTDKFNTKKGTFEHSLQANEVSSIKKMVLLSLTCSLPLLFTYQNYMSTAALLLFLFLGYAYSLPPLRLKARPLFDFSANCLYLLPGIISFSQTSTQAPAVPVLVGFFFWTAAMHLFSAVPDITADRAAGIPTTAVKLGFHKSLVVCTLFWLSTVLFVGQASGILVTLALLVYPSLSILTLILGPAKISKIYWFFPYLNITLGLIYFSYLYFT